MTFEIRAVKKVSLNVLLVFLMWNKKTLCFHDDKTVDVVHDGRLYTFFKGKLQKISIKKMLFFWTFYLSKNPEKKGFWRIT